MASLFNTLFGSVQMTCICVLATLGITLIFKTSFTTNFAQGSIAALGCYVTAEFVINSGMNLYLALAIGLAAGLACGLIVDTVIFRRGRNVNMLGKQIITMGLVSLIVNAIPLIFGNSMIVSFPSFVNGYFTFMMGGTEVYIQKNAVLCLAITAVIIALIFVLLKYSKWGLGVRATASNEYVAGMMGINTHAITAISWSVAGVLGVLAAVLLAGMNSISPLFMTKIQVNAFLAGILGGFATFYGPVIGAVLIPVATSLVGWLGGYVPAMSQWNEVIIYVLILIAVLIRPQGLFGKKIAKKV